MDDERDGYVEIDGPKRLSQSLIWHLQRRYYETVGLAAWEGQVPYYVTNHPYIAEAYARVVLGYLRDCRRERGDEPLTIIELGAGVGRFAYHFLRGLTALVERSALRGARVRYVLTDFTDAPFAWWREHPALRPYLEAGVLDIARFDATADQEPALCLEHARETLRPGALGGPLVVIANYVFDSIPHDAFQISGGALHDKLVAVRGPAGADPGATELIHTMALEYSDRPVERPYGDALLDGLVHDYAAELRDSALEFPVEAIRCLRRLHALAAGRLLLLSADHGYHDVADVLASAAPLPNVHGDFFSLLVNFHALGRATERLGGRALVPSHPYAMLDTCAFVIGLDDARETALAFAEALDALGPDDFYLVRRAVEQHLGSISLEQLLAHVRLSSYDATVFERAAPSLALRLRYTEPGPHHAEAARVAREVRDRHFTLPGEADLESAIGRVLEVACRT